jgi:ATP-dependent Clp protease adaptor protein ClpS
MDGRMCGDGKEIRVGTDKKPDGAGTGHGAETVLDRKSKTKRPQLFRVILHNDDYTTMEFVVFVLQEVFLKSVPEATHLMLTVHHKGKGVAGTFSRDIAETKVKRVSNLAEENGMPLLCTAEPDD